jgi:hypothetical protein
MRAIQRQRELANFWSTVPIGTVVSVRKDDGSEVETKTRSAGWLLGEDGNGKGGHTAVIMLEGISGCYALERVALVQVHPL